MKYTGVQTQILLHVAARKKKLADDVFTQVALAWMRQEQIHEARSLSRSPRRLGSRLWSLALEAQAETWFAGLALNTTIHPVQGWGSSLLGILWL